MSLIKQNYRSQSGPCRNKPYEFFPVDIIKEEKQENRHKTGQFKKEYSCQEAQQVKQHQEKTTTQ